LADKEELKMGFFPVLAASYVVFAFIFQAIAVGFISLDRQCGSSRILWAAVTIITGPIGILLYLFKGRQH